MTQHELFEKTFSALHASPDTILEVKKTMQNEKRPAASWDAAL